MTEKRFDADRARKPNTKRPLQVFESSLSGSQHTLAFDSLRSHEKSPRDISCTGVRLASLYGRPERMRGKTIDPGTLGTFRSHTQYKRMDRLHCRDTAPLSILGTLLRPYYLSLVRGRSRDKPPNRSRAGTCQLRITCTLLPTRCQCIAPPNSLHTISRPPWVLPSPECKANTRRSRP